MLGITIAAAVCGAAALWLGKKQPLLLEGRPWKLYIAAVLAVELWCVVMLRGTVLPGACAYLLLANVLVMMSVTDLREKMVYDIHFYVVLLAGILSALWGSGSFVSRILLFLILMGVLFLVSRKKDGLGMGDSRMIASLALYFSLSQWMEIMLLALGSAAAWGVIGMIRKKKTMATELPFMPYLLVGVLVEFMM